MVGQTVQPWKRRQTDRQTDATKYIISLASRSIIIHQSIYGTPHVFVFFKFIMSQSDNNVFEPTYAYTRLVLRIYFLSVCHWIKIYDLEPFHFQSWGFALTSFWQHKWKGLSTFTGEQLCDKRLSCLKEVDESHYIQHDTTKALTRPPALCPLCQYKCDAVWRGDVMWRCDIMAWRLMISGVLTETMHKGCPMGNFGNQLFNLAIICIRALIRDTQTKTLDW